MAGSNNDQQSVALDSTGPTGDLDREGKTEPDGFANGVQALDHLLRQGGDARAVVAIIEAHPRDRDAILTRLHSTLGNQYVGRVVGMLSGGRAAAVANNASVAPVGSSKEPSAPASLSLLDPFQNSADSSVCKVGDDTFAPPSSEIAPGHASANADQIAASL